MFAELHIQDHLGQGISTYQTFYRAIYFFSKGFQGKKKKSQIKKWPLLLSMVNES